MREANDLKKPSLLRTAFRAMNTEIEVMLPFSDHESAGEDIMAKPIEWFDYVEQKFSRFRPDSELSRINKCSGEIVLISDTMLEVLRLAEAYQYETNGIFHPLLLDAMEAAGYGKSFALMGSEPVFVNMPVDAVIDASMTVNDAMKSVQLHGNGRLDLGGIVKGWAAERLADMLPRHWGIRRGLINAGGDIVVWGGSPGADSALWQIDIADPWDEQKDAANIMIANGAVATSSKLGRQWFTNRGMHHHLIDPRTQLPSRSDVVQCTVTGPNLSRAEVWAKVICILGSVEGLSLFRKKTNGYEAMLFTEGKKIMFSGSHHPFQLEAGEQK